MTDPVPAARPPCPQGVPAEAAGPSPPAAGAPSKTLRGIVVGGFVAAVGLAVLRVDERVRGLDDFRVALDRAWFQSAPAWLPESERAALKDAARGEGTVALRGDGVPEAIAARLEADPRVRRVVACRRRHPDAVEVLLELRRPVALAETGGRSVAVDRDGRALPGDFAKHPLPRIRGGGDSAPEIGRPCGRAVREGASVVAAVPPEALATLGLDSVDVSGVESGGGVVLRRGSDRGNGALAVEWGRAPASPEADLDPPSDAKVRHLRTAAERFPGLGGLRTVRLAFDDLVVVPR